MFGIAIGIGAGIGRRIIAPTAAPFSTTEWQLITSEWQTITTTWN